MKIGRVILSIFYITFFCFANVQFDLRNYIIHAEEDPIGDHARSRRIWNFDSNIYASQNVSTHLSWYLQHRMDGSTVHMALPERIIPLVSHSALGLQYDNNILYHVGMTNDVLGRSSAIRPYYFSTVDSTMTQKFINSLNMRWEVDARKVDFLADFSYFRLNYDLGYEENEVTPAVDDDIWAEMYFAFKYTESFKIAIGTLLKTDLNTTSDYDYGDHYIGFEGDHTIKLTRARKLFIDWRIAEHYRISDALYYKGDAEGPATLIYLNPILKLRNKVYLKGNVKLDLSKKMQKQWYEFTLRKAWRGQTALDLSYWNILGSYFPRRGARARMALYLGRFGLIPDLRLYWRLNRDTMKYDYYRTTISLETLLNLNRIDLFAGYTYTYFKDLKDYDPLASRGGIYFGLRKW